MQGSREAGRRRAEHVQVVQSRAPLQPATLHTLC